MRITKPERFRLGYAGPRGTWLIGWIAFGLGAVFAGFIGDVGHTELTIYVAGGCLLSGIGLLTYGRVARRRELILSPEGVQFPVDQSLVRWSDVHSFSGRWITGDLRVHGRDGRVIGVVPSSIERFERAVLLMVEGPASSAPAVTSTFSGGRGSWGWIALLFASIYFLKGIDFDRLDDLSTPRLVGSAIFILLALWKGWGAWKWGGRTTVKIDGEGIEYASRAESWKVRWGEITALASDFHSAAPYGTWTISVEREYEAPHTISLTGMDLVGVLGAIKRHGGALWEPLILQGRHDPAILADPEPEWDEKIPRQRARDLGM